MKQKPRRAKDRNVERKHEQQLLMGAATILRKQIFESTTIVVIVNQNFNRSCTNIRWCVYMFERKNISKGPRKACMRYAKQPQSATRIGLIWTETRDQASPRQKELPAHLPRAESLQQHLWVNQRRGRPIDSKHNTEEEGR